MKGKRILLLGISLLLYGWGATLLPAQDKAPAPYELRGQVIVPPKTVPPRSRIVATLFGVTTPFRAQTWADFKGRFRFKRLPPATYTLSLFIPRTGEILQTVEITKSFADAKGRVAKTWEFDAESLRARARPVPTGTVSVRELSIPHKARREFEKAQSRLRSRDTQRAIEHLKKAVELAPQHLEALNTLGTIHLQQHDYAEAERYFRAALQEDPAAYEPMVNLGGVLLTQGREQEALEINRRAQEERPEDALANAQLGLNYYLLGEYENAIPYLERTEELDPAHFSNPQIPLAEIYRRRGQETQAVQELRDFLTQHPDSPHAQNVREVMERIQRSEANSAEERSSD